MLFKWLMNSRSDWQSNLRGKEHKRKRLNLQNYYKNNHLTKKNNKIITETSFYSLLRFLLIIYNILSFFLFVILLPYLRDRDLSLWYHWSVNHLCIIRLSCMLLYLMYKDSPMISDFLPQTMWLFCTYFAVSCLVACHLVVQWFGPWGEGGCPL